MSRILVVEDDAIISKDLASTLRRMGHTVVGEVGAGEEVSRAVDEWAPDLVLMDIRLEGSIDGVEAARRIADRSDVTVIYLTAHADEATLERAKATAPHGYVLKPFNERDLRTAIEVGMHRSIVDQRLAEREALLSSTLRSIGEGVIATDATDAVWFMNPGAERLTGWSLDDARGRRLVDVLRLHLGAGDGSSPTAQALNARTVAEGSTLVDRGGSPHAVDDCAAAIFDTRGHVLGTVAVLRDVTERSRERCRATTERGLAALRGVTAGLAHEINNPLSVIRTNLELAIAGLDALQSGTSGQPERLVGEVEECVRAAFDACGDVAHVVRGIQAAAESGRAEHDDGTSPEPETTTVDALETSPTAGTGRADRRRGRVLIVDDNVVLADALAAGLSDAHDVATADAPLAALQLLLDGERFDVILCDLMMPGLTGMDFLDALERALPDVARKVVFMTGGAVSERSDRFLRATSNRVLLKPFELDELRALVATMLDLS